MKIQKIFLITISIVLYSQGTLMAIEEAKYDVLQKFGAIEIRQYQPQVVAETTVEGDFSNAANAAFGRLFNYISGANRTQQSIAMTAPVGQQKGEKIAMTAPVGQQKTGDRYVVSFMMPARYTLETLPEPTDWRVSLRAIPAQTVAAIRYGGTWSQSRYKNHEDKLRTFIEQQGYTVKGEPIWARYNPPFTPWFLRRNEILMEIEPMKTAKTHPDTIYAFRVNDIDGNAVSLSDYKGKVVLIVNVASKCGFTKQYAGLQTLYERYKDKGFVVLGFPANNFGVQEPGTEEEIKAFC